MSQAAPLSCKNNEAHCADSIEERAIILVEAAYRVEKATKRARKIGLDPVVICIQYDKPIYKRSSYVELSCLGADI